MNIKDMNLTIFSGRAVGFVLAFLVLLSVTAPAIRAQGLSLIRDTEIENTIRAYAAPLFTVAGLDADAVSVHIVDDSRLNAFVAGGMNLFVNTGLLMSSDTPDAIIGVLAHEIGHIAGGHLARTREAVENATAEAMLAYILGAAAILAGGGQAGGAIIGTGSAIAYQSLIRYSQAQEQSADQAAVRYLEAVGRSAEGMLDIFYKLEDQELLVAERQDPYLRSHPLTRDRIRFVRNFVETSNYTSRTADAAELLAHRRMVAKLYAYLNSPGKTLRVYRENDTSLTARYARAIAYYRIPDIERAIAKIDALLRDHPDDPWFHELKGQILFENGLISLSIPPYERAVALRPGEPLLRLGLARAQIEINEPGFTKKAIDNLVVAARAEPNYAPHWHFMGIAYGRDQQLAQSSLALAEASLLRNELTEANYHAEKAKRGLKLGTPSYLRAEDIILAASHRKR
ncbi:MAG: Beta-barrel assembly-enhancing protease [Alphaproteobacteria bacterium MarineAlpha10_Bin2]|nr:MAG: Beta-barrel assembly-enhancing protease [Alphaproteobacteria bacterium MarineAlpha10_Bin2]